MSNAYIKEIFTSVQGEGLYVGEMQIFVRFCHCNLNCKYCDTDFKKNNKTIEYSAKDLAEYLLHNETQTISLTGGEPLLEVSFLKEFLTLMKKHKTIYLETNGTLTNELAVIVDDVDIICADIKIQSATKQPNQFEINDEFLSVAKKKYCFIKVVFDENIDKYEISEIIRIAKKHDLPIVLQPMMNRNLLSLSGNKIMEIYRIFYALYPNTRLIPQMHKFLKVM